MINILFIATEFPPIATAGVFRSLKFVKYLRKNGINPIVITLTEYSARDIFGDNIDYQLLDEVPPDIEIIRVKCNSIKKNYSSKIRKFITIFFKNSDVIARTWKDNIIQSSAHIVKEKSPVLIYTSLPPFSIGKLGVQLAKKYGIPLITDMRDGWSTWRTNPYGSYLHYFLTKREERLVFTNSTEIIGSTQELINIFIKDHPTIDKSKFNFIPNGFDSELSTDTFSIPSYNDKKKIKIGYVGAFYYTPKGREDIFKPWWKKKGHRRLQYTPVKEDWLYRSPYYFFKIIESALLKEPKFLDYIELHFIGKKPDWIEKMISQITLPIKIVFHGQMDYNHCNQVLETFDAVFVTSAKRNNGLDWPLPSKVFDYVTNKKLIISVCPKGATRNFIINTNTGIILDPDNIGKSSQKFIEALNKGYIQRVNTKILDSYKRQNTTKTLANLVKLVVNKQPKN